MYLVIKEFDFSCLQQTCWSQGWKWWPTATEVRWQFLSIYLHITKYLYSHPIRISPWWHITLETGDNRWGGCRKHEPTGAPSGLPQYQVKIPGFKYKYKYKYKYKCKCREFPAPGRRRLELETSITCTDGSKRTVPRWPIVKMIKIIKIIKIIIFIVLILIIIIKKSRWLLFAENNHFDRRSDSHFDGDADDVDDEGGVGVNGDGDGDDVDDDDCRWRHL